MRAFLVLLLIPFLYSCGSGYSDSEGDDGEYREHKVEEQETETEETTTTQTKKNNK